MCGEPPIGHETPKCIDLFGIIIMDIPDLRRILLPDDLEGNPLRKIIRFRNFITDEGSVLTLND